MGELGWVEEVNLFARSSSKGRDVRRKALLSGVAGLREGSTALNWGGRWYQPWGRVGELEENTPLGVCLWSRGVGAIFAWSRGVGSWVGGGSYGARKYQGAGGNWSRESCWHGTGRG